MKDHGLSIFFVWDSETRQIVWKETKSAITNSKYLHNATFKFHLIFQFPWINTEYDQVSKQYIMKVWKKVASYITN